VNDRVPHHAPSTWAVVLAGGDGSRLKSLTRNSAGILVPKQFCSLQGGPCLLQNALQRALAVAPPRRICAVLAAQHRHWWEGLFMLPERNLIVEPHNRGTAHGILLALVQILARDPDACVVLLPADHYLRDEDAMAGSLSRVAELAKTNDRTIYLLGVEPDQPDTELGYIVPSSRRFSDRPSQVARFVEKPDLETAKALLNQGALWNAFILAGSVWALLRLFDASFSSTIVALSHRAEHQVLFEPAAFDRWYAQLPSLDFSRDVLEGHEAYLQVLPVPRCGWTDLGTPHRIGRTLQGLRERRDASRRPAEGFSHLNLAEQYARASAAIDARALPH
jgi:mannose-1-phosphate guanylyltransferase